MRDWTKPAVTFLLSLGLFALCLFVYLSKLPVNFTYDGMVFAERVENSDTPLYKFFHPHHLIYAFLGRLFYLWGRDRGAAWDGMVALQFFDILIGILGVLIAFHLLVRKTKDPFVSFLTALGMSFTFSYWYFSTSPGVRIFATVTPLLTWYLLTFLKERGPAFGVLLGLSHGLAVLGHQTNLMLIPAFLGGICCVREKSAGERFWFCIYYLSSLTLGVLSFYAFVGRFIYFHKTYASWIYWVFAYFHVQGWGGYLPAAGFEQGKLAMLKAFLSKTNPDPGPNQPITLEFVKTLFQYAIFICLGFLLVRFRLFWESYRQTLWVGVLWIGVFVPFFLWWEPWNIEFLVSSTVPCWILMGVTVSAISQRWTNPVLHFANRGIVILLWTGLVALLYLYNFQSSIKKTAVTHSAKPLLEAIDWKVGAEDLLMLTGINTVPFYIDRYQKRHYLSLHSFLRKYEVKKDKPPANHSQGRDQDPWEDLSLLLDHTWKRHHKVWVLSEVVNKNDEWNLKFIRLMNLPPDRLSQFLGQYLLKPVPYHGKTYFYSMSKPIPTPIPAAPPSKEPVPGTKGGKKLGKKT